MKKKISYILCSFVLGAVFATAGSAFAGQVKSLIGQKVTGEYSVIINGKTLSDKGVIVDSKANIPIRSLFKELEAEVKVAGKTITVTTGVSEVSQQPGTGVTTTTVNPYIDLSKQELEKKKASLQLNFLAPRLKGQTEILAEIEQLEKAGATGVGDSLEAKKNQLVEYESAIKKYTAELEQVDEALAAIK